MNLPLDGKYQTQVFTELFHQETFGCIWAYKSIIEKDIEKGCSKDKPMSVIDDLVWFTIVFTYWSQATRAM